MFKKGDKYIQFTKYGGINFGEVESLGVLTIIDGDKGIYYEKRYIRTTKGISLLLDGGDGQIYKITHTMSEKELEDYKRLGKFMYSKNYTERKIINAIQKSIREYKEE